MNTQLVIIVAVLVLAVVVVALVMVRRRRHRTEGLKEQFGPEYEHAVGEFGGPQKAEQELQARQKRVEALNIQPLAPAVRDQFAEQWRKTQAEFVDAPDRAVAEAGRLVKQVMQQRGYPVGDFEQRAADISVDHPNVVTHYRTAREIALKQEAGKATTEDLRQAMVHYKALFDDLLQTDTSETVNAG